MFLFSIGVSWQDISKLCLSWAMSQVLCLVCIHKLIEGWDWCYFMLLSLWSTNPMTKKHNDDTLAKGKDLIATWVGGQIWDFLKSVLFSGASIIWPMYIKWSAVTDTAINGSSKCTLMKRPQSIVTQHDTQVSSVWIENTVHLNPHCSPYLPTSWKQHTRFMGFTDTEDNIQHHVFILFSNNKRPNILVAVSDLHSHWFWCSSNFRWHLINTLNMLY